MSLKELADKSGRDLEGLKNRFEQLAGRLTAEGMPREQAEKKALQIIRADLKFKRNKTRWFTGIVVGLSPIEDRLETIRRKARSRLSTSPEAAIAEGLVDSQGNILDTRDRIFGRKNPNYGKPIGDQHDYFREAWGLLLEDNIWKRFRIDMYGEACFKISIPLLKLQDFNALSKGETNEGVILRASSFTTFKDAQPVKASFDLKALLKKLYPVYTLKAAFSSSQLKTRIPFFTKGYVAVVKDLGERAMMLLDDEELDWNERAVIFMDKNVKIPRQDSEITVFGRGWVRTLNGFSSLVITPFNIWGEDFKLVD